MSDEAQTLRINTLAEFVVALFLSVNEEMKGAGGGEELFMNEETVYKAVSATTGTHDLNIPLTAEMMVEAVDAVLRYAIEHYETVATFPRSLPGLQCAQMILVNLAIADQGMQESPAAFLCRSQEARERFEDLVTVFVRACLDFQDQQSSGDVSDPGLSEEEQEVMLTWAVIADDILADRTLREAYGRAVDGRIGDREFRHVLIAAIVERVGEAGTLTLEALRLSIEEAEREIESRHFGVTSKSSRALC